VSTKYCKGIVKSFLNRSLWAENRHPPRRAPLHERGGPDECARRAAQQDRHRTGAGSPVERNGHATCAASPTARRRARRRHRPAMILCATLPTFSG
jgi:hypothetical protein